MRATEGTFSTQDGTELYTKTWTPDSPSSNHLVFIHGFSDHINTYYNLFPTFASPPYNITVYGFDQRGWGRSVHSKSDRGKTGETHQVLSDIHDFIKHVSGTIKLPDAKLFLMGHSMGGAESLMYMLTDSLMSSKSGSTLPLAGVLLEAPHIGFPAGAHPNSLLVFAGRLANKVFPNLQMVQKLESSAICRDPKVCKDWDNDELCHDTGTLRGLSGLLDRASYLNGLGSGSTTAQAGMLDKLPCPVWWGHGTADKVCDFTCSKKLYDKLISNSQGTKQADLSKFVAYEGGYHKLNSEPDGMGEQFARDVGDWIVRVGGSTASVSAASSGAPMTSEAAETSKATAGTNTVSEDEGSEVKSRL